MPYLLVVLYTLDLQLSICTVGIGKFDYRDSPAVIYGVGKKFPTSPICVQILIKIYSCFSKFPVFRFFLPLATRVSSNFFAFENVQNIFRPKNFIVFSSKNCS